MALFMLGSVDKLQRRNQDYKLLETIKRVGVQNYSLLARLTGLNAETIRYKVNRHLSKLGLATTIDVNYGQLGLAMGYLTVKPNGTTGKSWYDRMSYVVFSGKKMGSNSHFCLTAVPFRLKKKKKIGCAEHYVISRFSAYDCPKTQISLD